MQRNRLRVHLAAQFSAATANPVADTLAVLYALTEREISDVGEGKLKMGVVLRGVGVRVGMWRGWRGVLWWGGVALVAYGGFGVVGRVFRSRMRFSISGRLTRIEKVH